MSGTVALTPKVVWCPECKAKQDAPCKRPSGHTVFGGDFHKKRKDRFEKLSKTLKDTDTINTYSRRSYVYLDVPCPVCEAPEHVPCDTLSALYDMHHRRQSAYFDSKGISLEARHESPYRHWPDADDFKFWAIMVHRRSTASGNYGPKPVKMPYSGRPAVFRNYKEAEHWEKKLEKNAKWRKKPGNGGCIGVFPYFEKVDGTWGHHEY